tara:strand:- start:357 stop:509 length:153 start_codon:yes stop_codon:yes gene_type:complete
MAGSNADATKLFLADPWILRLSSNTLKREKYFMTAECIGETAEIIASGVQ